MSVVISGIDKPEILKQALDAKTFQPLTHAQIHDLLQRTREVALSGKTELFKTFMYFDSTAKHPEWLDPQQLRGPSASANL